MLLNLADKFESEEISRRKKSAQITRSKTLHNNSLKF